MTGQFRPEQMELGEVPAADIPINPGSREDVPKIHRGIRFLVSNRKFRIAPERLSAAGFLSGAKSRQGRPGMDLWRVFVLGILEQGLGCDFDRLTHHANRDTLARQFHGHADFIDNYEKKRQTLADSIRPICAGAHRQDQRDCRGTRARDRGKKARRAETRALRFQTT